MDYDAVKSYFKFTFVRDPTTRLHSAYRFLVNGGLHQRDVAFRDTYLIDKSFDQFVEGLSDGSIPMTYHLLRPQMDFIATGDRKILVDFVGRFENLNNDFQVVADRLGIERKLEHLNKSPNVSPDHAIADITKARIRSIYESDFTVLRY